MKRLRGTLLLEGLVQERLDVGLIPMPLHVGEILGSLDILISDTGSRLVTIFKGTARRSVYRMVSSRPDLVRPKQSTRSSRSCG
jgi:hypothetical protein